MFGGKLITHLCVSDADLILVAGRECGTNDGPHSVCRRSRNRTDRFVQSWLAFSIVDHPVSRGLVIIRH